MSASVSLLQSPVNLHNRIPHLNQAEYISQPDHFSVSGSSGSSRQLHSYSPDSHIQSHLKPQQMLYLASSSHETTHIPHTQGYKSDFESLRNENLALTKKIIILEAKLDTANDNYNKLLEKVNTSYVEGNGLMSKHLLPPPLHQKDHKSVKFWSEKSYEEYQRRNNGDTDGLATNKPRCGRPSKSDENEDKHPYLEDNTGTPAVSLAVPSWGRLGLNASDYIKIEMVSEFEEFQLCEGFWKLER
ncbi:hypothetical protein BDZ94DRAFT_1309018 [Collybia nuda]|uniref:Uncharacterized protein n=1 Tax=Collybia nuda TaxID=64659 RepID=A0A9P5Y881_9AGAR|nr:hypothetical protein BDZ94DRAFT_1309018 [Collybia nuda]